MSISNPNPVEKNPAKRPRHSSPPLSSDLATQPEDQLAFPDSDWSSKMKIFAEKVRTMWLDICDSGMPADWSPSIREDLDSLQLALSDTFSGTQLAIDKLYTSYYSASRPADQVASPHEAAKPDTPGPPAADAQSLAPKTYARAAATHPRPRLPHAKTQPKAASLPPKSPVRVVLQLQGHDSIPARNLPPPELFRQLTETIAASSTARDTKLMDTQCNKKGNLVLAFSPGTSRTSIRTTLPAIFSVFELAEKPPVIFDVPWAKVRLANIPARQHTAAPLFSEDLLQQSLALNPAIQDLRITRPVRWIHKPDFIAGMRTSAVLTFEDPDGSLVRASLKTPIFAFGTPVTVKKWQDKPPVRRKGSGAN